MDEKKVVKETSFLELFEACEEVEKKKKALEVLKDWLYTDEIDRIEKKIEDFRSRNKVFITKKFRLNEAHKDLLPFMRAAKARALEKIIDRGILKDEDNAFRCP